MNDGGRLLCRLMLLQRGFELRDALFHGIKLLDNFLLCLLTRCARLCVSRCRSTGRSVDTSLLTMERQRQQHRGDCDQDRPLAGFYCRRVHSVLRIHDYRFSTSVSWTEFREVNSYWLRRQTLPFFQKGGKKPQHENHRACTQ